MSFALSHRIRATVRPKWQMSPFNMDKICLSTSVFALEEDDNDVASVEFGTCDELSESFRSWA